MKNSVDEAASDPVDVTENSILDTDVSIEANIEVIFVITALDAAVVVVVVVVVDDVNG